jgi:hypothetical protein
MLTALITRGQSLGMLYYFNNALDDAEGLTLAEISEVITHLAFYTGWPLAISATGVVKTFFEPPRAEERAGAVRPGGAGGRSWSPAPDKCSDSRQDAPARHDPSTGEITNMER